MNDKTRLFAFFEFLEDYKLLKSDILMILIFPQSSFLAKYQDFRLFKPDQLFSTIFTVSCTHHANEKQNAEVDS